MTRVQEVSAIRSLSDAGDRAEIATLIVESVYTYRHEAVQHEGTPDRYHEAWMSVDVCRYLAGELLASQPPLSEEQLLRLFRAASRHLEEWIEAFVPVELIGEALLRYTASEKCGTHLRILAMEFQARLAQKPRFQAAASTLREARLQGICRTDDGGLQADREALLLLDRFSSDPSLYDSRCGGDVDETLNRIRAASPKVRSALVRLGLGDFAAVADEVRRSTIHPEWQLASFCTCASWALPLSRQIASLLMDGVPLSDTDILACVRSCCAYGMVNEEAMPHIGALISYLERRFTADPPSDDVRSAVESLADLAGEGGRASAARLQRRLRSIATGETPWPIDGGEAWSDCAIGDLRSMTKPERKAWLDLLGHCETAHGSKPTTKWNAWKKAHRSDLRQSQTVQVLCKWFELVDKPRTAPVTASVVWGDRTHLISDANADILKGLCWIAGTIESPDLARALGRLAISCYRKVPGVGPRAVKVGNAAVYALGQMPGRDSLGQLAMLRVKVKFGTAQKLLEKALNAAAEREGLPREEIDELGVPSYGLTEVGLRREPLGDYTAELRVEGFAKPVLGFHKPDGKPQKSVPAAIRETHAADLKELKAAAKDIAAMLPAQRDRIDGLFLEDKSWDLPTWRERYLDHPLVGVITRRLLWRFARGRDRAWDAGAPARSAMWLDGVGLVGLDAEPVEPDDPTTRVRLWHPIEVEQAEILAWREFLERHQLVQPFKQAHREVYLLTDAERNTGVYSNRYAAHVLRQHQFNALCAARRWKNKLRLMVDDEFPPASRTLPAWNLRAEFWIEGAGADYGGDTNETGVFNHLITDQVRFYGVGAASNSAHAGGGGYGMYADRHAINDPLPLDRIPPMVFSEIMRDVDLFVGVTSVGNNPAWQDGGPEGRYRDYWWSYSFGDLSGTAETRRDILSRLVPRLKIADRCSVGARYLTVRGDLRTYKIHLGSGNILMEPNDQYLCIVASSRADPTLPPKLYLPFEGDRTLAIILSKAFLLAADTEITDSTITSQIRRG
jgi:hypothetical protein